MKEGLPKIEKIKSERNEAKEKIGQKAKKRKSLLLKNYNVSTGWPLFFYALCFLNCFLGHVAKIVFNRLNSGCYLLGILQKKLLCPKVLQTQH